MATRIDLNADLGEGFGTWVMGDDAALLDVVTSANIACGFHAGDPDVMARTMRLAVENNVGIGAHPGFADLQGFGRRRMSLSADSLANLVWYQLGAADAIARANGGAVRHFKLHGALANMAAENLDIARVTFEVAIGFRPDLVLVAIAGTAQQQAAEALGAAYAAEIYADRGYNDDATLLDRSQPGAVIHDPALAAARVVAMVRDGAIHAASGRRIPTRIDTVCVHGDTPEAVATAHAVRAGLKATGLDLRRF